MKTHKTLWLAGALLLCLAIAPWSAAADRASAQTNSIMPALPFGDTGATWRSGGPYGGSVQALALSPAFATDGLALAGGWRTGRYSSFPDGYGIARTTDGGATWQLLQDEQHAWAVFDLAISPNFAADRTAFAGTDVGLLRSADRGDTWTRLYGGLPDSAPHDPAGIDDIGRVILSPAFATDRILFAVQRDGALYRSADGGDHWTRVLDGGVVFAAAFARQFAVNQVAFAAQFDGRFASNLMRSTDGGQTWTFVQALSGVKVNDLLETADGALLLATTGGVVRLVSAPANQQISKSANQQISESANQPHSSPSDSSFIEDPISPNIGAEVTRVAVAGDNVYAAAQNGLFISLSFGRSWQRVAGTPEAAFRAIAPCPLWGSCHAVMAGTYTGLLFTPDDNWQPWRGLPGPHRLRANSVAASPAYVADGILYASTDHGIFRSADRGLSWQLATASVTPGDSYNFPAVRVSASYATDGTVFATYEDATAVVSGLYKSTDRGQTWTVSWGLSGRALALSPAYATDRTVFLANGDQLRKSTDGGATWQTYPLAPPEEGFFVYDLEVSSAYALDRTLFATGFGRVRRSADGGLTWTELSTMSPSYGLALSPSYSADGTVWHTFRAIEGPGDGSPESGVRRSTDRGLTWTWATAGLPGVYEPFPIPLAVSPSYTADRTLFTALSGQFVAGDSHSLYRSMNGGDSWLDLGHAPGNPNPFDLAATTNPGGGLIAHLATAAGVWHYAATCEERLVNGGFEQNLAWQLPTTAYPAVYSAAVVHSGARSLRTGIVSGPDVYSYSSGNQAVTIPTGVASATWSFWWYPISAEGSVGAQDLKVEAEVEFSASASTLASILQGVADGTLPAGVLAGDWQYALVLDEDGAVIPGSPRLWTRSDARAWQRLSLDLTPYRGRLIYVVFGTLNDGNGRSSAMYVDDASLTTCWPAPPEPSPTPTRTVSPTPTRTPTPTPTRGAVRPRAYLPLILNRYTAPTPPVASATPTGTQTPTRTPTRTPSPTATGAPSLTPTETRTATPTTPPTVTPTPIADRTCYEGLVNGGFEADTGWTIKLNPVLAAYATSPVRTGSRSMRTGIQGGGTNVESYSPIEQRVTFPAVPPATTLVARLNFWRYRVYGDGAVAENVIARSGLCDEAISSDAGDCFANGARNDREDLPRTEAEFLTATFPYDFFYVIAIHDDGTIDWLLRESVNDPAWQWALLDVSRYAGQSVRLQFGTYNNGSDGISRTYLDDVFLQICPPPGALVLPGGWVSRVIGRPEMNTVYAVAGSVLYRSDYAGDHWYPIGTPRPEQTILSASPSLLYAGDGYPCYRGGDPAPMWRTSDSGMSWQQLPAGLNLKPLAAHPLDTRLYAAGCNGPYLSLDAGASFTHQPDPLFGVLDVYFIAPVGTAWSTVWIGAMSEGGEGAALVSRNGGASWSQSTPFGLNMGWLGDFMVDRFQPGRVYAPAVYGFFYTTDDGATWLNGSAGLGDVIDPGTADRSYGLLALAQDPSAHPGYLYLGTVRGLYARDPATLAWYKINGQPYDTLRVEDLLALDGAPNRLFVTTPLGVYLYDLGLLPPPPTPTATPPTPATPTPTRTPTPTPTPSPSPTPTATGTAQPIPTAAAQAWPAPYLLRTVNLPAGSHPHGIALSTAGDAAYVAFHGGAHDGHVLGVVNTIALSLTGQIELAPGGIGPNGVALAGSPAKVIVANRETANVAAVDPGAGAVARWLTAGAMPDGVAVAGAYGYVANFGNDTVTVFDAISLTVTGELHVGHEPALFATDPTTGNVYLSLHGANAVARLHDGMVAGQINDIPAPYGLAFDSVNRRLYVANRGGAQTVTVLDVDGGVLGTIGVGKEPFVLAVNPDSGHLFVACGDEVKVYRTLDWAPVTSIAIPAGAEEGITVDSGRDRVYVTSGVGDAVTVIQDAAAPGVLFVSSRDGNGELYRMLPDGREPKRLTTTAAWENAPAGSPDGRWIAYERADADGVAHLWLMSRDGLLPRQLTSGAATDLHPTWSAGGQWLAFASDRAGNWELYRLRLADGYLERLTYNTAADLNPAWSWGNGRIFFQSSRSSPNGEIFSMAPDGSDVRRLTANPNGDTWPSPSPAGDRVVFWGTRGEQTLYVLMPDGVTILPLVSRGLRPGAAAWGPANADSVIVFSGYRPGSGYSELFRVAADGSGLALLTFNEIDWDYAPGWLPAP